MSGRYGGDGRVVQRESTECLRKVWSAVSRLPTSGESLKLSERHASHHVPCAGAPDDCSRSCRLRRSLAANCANHAIRTKRCRWHNCRRAEISPDGFIAGFDVADDT